MNKLLIMSTLLISFSAFADNYKVIKTDKCKTRATAAAYYKYKKESGVSMIQVFAQENSVLENGVLSHIIDINEFNSNVNTTITVSVDAETCSILNIH